MRFRKARYGRGRPVRRGRRGYGRGRGRGRGRMRRRRSFRPLRIGGRM